MLIFIVKQYKMLLLIFLVKYFNKNAYNYTILIRIGIGTGVEGHRYFGESGVQ